jgi:hypothetical protein
MKCAYKGCNTNQILHESFCVFHAPASAKGISDDEVSKALRDQVSIGLCDLDGFIIPAFADLSGFEIRKPFSTKSARFLNGASFKGSIFHAPAHFEDTQFGGNTDFSGSIFHNGIHFNKCHFNNKPGSIVDQVLFDGMQIEKLADFSETQFNSGQTSFNYAVFDCDKISYHKTLFGEGTVTFIGSHYKGESINFLDATFKSSFYFVETAFECNEISFIKTHFNGANGKFQGCRFLGNVYIRNIDISCQLDFDDMKFHVSQGLRAPDFVGGA